MNNIKRIKFLTYDEQIEKLKKQHLYIEDEDVAKQILSDTSFYALIHGYRDVFRSKETRMYKPKANFSSIHKLYSFDENLRQILMSHILTIERKLKSIYSYSFCKMFGDDYLDYLNPNNYNYDQFKNDVDDLIENHLRRASNSDRPYIIHHKNKYGYVPLWVLVNSLTFGNMSVAYKCSDQSLKSKIAKEYSSYCIYSNQLEAMLSVLSKFRNVCAHNERLFMYKTKKALTDLPIHKTLEPTQGKNDIFSVCIIFKYLLDSTEFDSFINSLEQAINEYLNSIDESIKNDILKCMGLIENWRDKLTAKIT